MIQINVRDRGRVDASVTVEVPLAASTVWGQMRDITSFVTIDPLHHRLRLEQADDAPFPPPAGVAIVLEHRLFGIGPDRIGRLLRWREGEGYALSDLSKRGVTQGFPHICTYNVEPVDAQSSRVRVGARGRWTATWMPRWMIHAWLRWVLTHTEWHLERWFRLFIASRKQESCDSDRSVQC